MPCKAGVHSAATIRQLHPHINCLLSFLDQQVTSDCPSAHGVTSRHVKLAGCCQRPVHLHANADYIMRPACVLEQSRVGVVILPSMSQLV
jgi:hypothetical protein